MRILGKNIKSDIFNTNKSPISDIILHEWNKIYRYTRTMPDIHRPAINAFKDRLALVHTLRYSRESDCPFLSGRAEDIFATWDIISTSLVRIQSSMYERTQWADVGFILAAPAQNIIGAFHKDVWFPNHAGKEGAVTVNSYALAEHYFKGISKSNNRRALRYLKTAMPEKTYAHLYDPKSLISKTSSTLHNEVLVVGKRDVNTYEGHPPTDRIKVCGLYFLHNEIQEKNRQRYNENCALLLKLKALNPELPVIEHAF